MSRPGSFEAMTDTQLARYISVGIKASSWSILAIFACVVAGIWVDLRWLATALVFVAALAICFFSSILARVEQMKREDAS